MDPIKVPPTIPQQALSPSNTPNSVLSTTDQLGSTYNNFMTQLADLTKQYSTAMTPTSQEQDLIGQLNALNQGERQGLLNVENKVIPMEFITGQQASIQKQAAINRQALSENLTALQGNRQAQLDSLSKQIELANLGYSTTADFDKLQREANKLDTNIITLDNGRTLLVDTQTGNILKDYGGIKPSTTTGIGGITVPSGQEGLSNLLSVAEGLAVNFPQESQRKLYLQNVANYAQSGNEEALKDYVFKTAVNSLGTTESGKTYNRYLMTKTLSNLQDQLNAYYQAGGKTNILAGTKQGVLKKAGFVGNKELYKIAEGIANSVDELARYRTGAALTDSEEKFYNNIFPSIFRGSKANEAAITGLQDSLNSYIDASLGFALGSQGVNTFLNSTGGTYQGISNQTVQTPTQNDPLGIL